jgi:hypothetical protein
LRVFHKLSDIGAQAPERLLVNVHHVPGFVVTGGKIPEQHRVEADVMQSIVNILGGGIAASICDLTFPPGWFRRQQQGGHSKTNRSEATSIFTGGRIADILSA